MPQRQSGLILRARVVLPICRQPIDNGAVFISGGTIDSVGSWCELRSRATGTAPVEDLGDVVLLPGLINAHCHLDYTGFAGRLPAGPSFTDWIRRIIEAKEGLTQADYRRSWIRGARMLAASGVSSVVDIEAVPALLPSVWGETPLRVWSCLEMTGALGDRSAGEALSETLAAMPRGGSQRGGAGLSPHALYSTPPELVRLSGEVAEREGFPLTMHLAESAEETGMFEGARGELHDWLRGMGRDMSDCGGRTPVEAAARLGILGKRLLAVHVNCLGADDATLLGRADVSVAHCPRSHAFFGHPRFEYDRLIRAGVNICLGTDSLASTGKDGNGETRLSLFSEMRAFADAHLNATPDEILRMGTVGGARALGQSGRIGELIPGALADLLAAPHDGGVETAAEAVIEARDGTGRLMIAGEWVD